MTKMKTDLIDRVKAAAAEVTWKADTIFEEVGMFALYPPRNDVYRGRLSEEDRTVEVFRRNCNGRYKYGVGWGWIFRLAPTNEYDVYQDETFDGRLRDLYTLVEKTYKAQQSSKK